MKLSTLFLSCLITLMACETYNEDVVEIAGIYQGRLVGENGTFDLSISLENGDDILIEAPFDGSIWDIVYADVDCEDCDIKEIEIEDQRLDDDVFIEGFGLYSFGTIQLDYIMNIYGEEYQFTLIASK